MKNKQPEIPQLELLTPLAGEFFPNNAGGAFCKEMEQLYGIPLAGEHLAQYEEVISAMIQRQNGVTQEHPIPIDLMKYFYGSGSIKEKVCSAVVSVKNIDGVLYGCTTLVLRDFLEAPELKEMCEYITGQYADGWGEGFEQKDIPVDGGYLNIHFYVHGDLQIKEREPKQVVMNSITRERPKLKLLGHDGNIYSIMGDARRMLIRNGQGEEADEMCRRVEESGDYYRALGVISEYVETELSPTRETDRNCKKPERGNCR